jgi:hypothetical protein
MEMEPIPIIEKIPVDSLMCDIGKIHFAKLEEPVKKEAELQAKMRAAFAGVEDIEKLIEITKNNIITNQLTIDDFAEIHEVYYN